MPQMRGATEEEKKRRYLSVPGGLYVLVAIDFERKTADKKPFNDFIKFQFAIVKPDGTLGRKFRDIFGLLLNTDDEAKKKAAAFNVTRWQIWMEIFGIEEQFEIGSVAEGTEKEGDRNIARLFLNRPFVADVDRREQATGYINNSIRRLIPRKNWTELDLKKEAAFNAQQAQRGKPEDSVDDDNLDQYDDEAPPMDEDLPLGF